MAGKKGKSGRFSKGDEWDWHDLIGENKTLLLKLAKRMRIDAGELEPEKLEAIMQNPDKRKLFFKALDVAAAICVKSMPQKVEGTGEDGEIVIRVENGNPEENGHNLQAPRFAVPHLS